MAASEGQAVYHALEITYHFDHPFEVVAHVADMQKRKKPVYESCEVSFCEEGRADGEAALTIVTYHAAVPWYLRWLLPEHFDWEDRITVDSVARRRTEAGRNLSMPETYDIKEVSTWSADAAGTGTDYLKVVDMDVSFLPQAVVQQVANMVKGMSLQTREAERLLVEEHVQQEAAAAAAAAAAVECDAHEVAAAQSTGAAPAPVGTDSTSILVTDEVQQFAIAS